MNKYTFDKIVTDQLSRSELLLTSKGHEYAEGADDFTNVDRLAHFKKAAALQDETPAQAAFGMLNLMGSSDITEGTAGAYTKDTFVEAAKGAKLKAKYTQTGTAATAGAAKIYVFAVGVPA